MMINTKTTQKELKARYEDILRRDVWGDEKMISYCVKKAAHIVELENGDIIVIEKPSIKKDFCFGYSDSRYDTEDYDRANAMAERAGQDEEYFRNANLRDINREIEQLESQDSNSRYIFCVNTPYTGQPKDSPLKTIERVDKHSENISDYTPLSNTDLEKIIRGYEVVKEQFEKRLNAYLKRYGMSKVNTWSYWRDA
jgi:hypothetical protein